MNTSEKIFIVSLPRSATTSACLYLLEQGYSVAHTAYSQAAINAANVLADTPVFVDYSLLSSQFPKAKIVYLERPLDDWIHSIRRLLRSMRKQCARDRSVFEPDLLRCFNAVFPQFESMLDFSDEYLLKCYRAHEADVKQFILEREVPFLRIDITQEGAGRKLLEFCKGIPVNEVVPELPHVNRGRRITYWDDVKLAGKIDSYL